MLSSKLKVASQNGTCRVTVNGAPRGYTPFEVDLPVGSYDIGCNTVGWKSPIQRVRVSAGKVNRATFIVPR
jgi:hypothetical protein